VGQTTCLVNGVDMQAAALQFPFGQKAKSLSWRHQPELENVDAFRTASTEPSGTWPRSTA
jgi:hypothetical protein